jgi:hypothetical protein
MNRSIQPVLMQLTSNNENNWQRYVNMNDPIINYLLSKKE